MGLVVSIANAAELRESRESWNKLVVQMRYPSIFCTWEWIFTWWECLADKESSVILFVYSGNELRGILPLAKRWAFLDHHWATGRVLGFCGAEVLYPDHLDIICAREDEDACVASVLEFLSRDFQAWDVLLLDLVPPDGPLACGLNARTKVMSCREVEINFPRRVYYLPLNKTFEDYFRSFSKKRRYNLISRRKKLMEDHEVQFVASEPESEQEVLNQLFKLHRLRARRKGIRSSFDKAVVRRFHGSLIERMKERGWVNLRLLRNEQEIIAVSYNFIFAGTVFSFQKGIHPDWERYGPGTVLYYELIREAFLTGMKEYNFLHGSEDYKREWTSDFRSLASISVIRDSPLGALSQVLFKTKEQMRNYREPCR